MTETVSEFKARVARWRKRYFAEREGTAVFLAMAAETYGATLEQARFAGRLSGSEIDPFHNDANIPAFLAAAVEAGVLREG